MAFHVVGLIDHQASERRTHSIRRIIYFALKARSTVDKEQMMVADYHRSLCKSFLGLEIEVSADTIVWFSDRIYGKPRDLEEAKEFLRELAGKVHTVFTGVAFDGEVKVVRSDVKFRELSEATIEEYVARVRPTDRAGAYDIDESGDLIVESYSGSYENIMGLPVEPLKEWGIA